MSIRVERDKEFWRKVLFHDDVKDTLLDLSPDEFLECITSPVVTPLADIHGGFICARVGSTPLVQEFHTAFLPEGWGREVHNAAKEAIGYMFNNGVKLLITYEDKNNPRSRPPKSFGFETDTGPNNKYQLWFLSLGNWLASPAYRRLQCPPSH